MDKCFEINKEILEDIIEKKVVLDAIVTSPKDEYMGCSGCKKGQRRCGMILTKKCQLKCTYCYEKAKNASSMDFETAKSIIQKELENDKSIESVHIDFFGGEPFLAFNVMKELVDYLKSDNFGKDFYITTITNGIAIHGEIQDWLLANRGVIECPLSLDGTRAMQEKNRPGSFDRIDLDFFSREFPGTRVKMTVSPNTLCDLAEGTIFLHGLNFSPKNGLAYGVEWPQDCQKVLIRELNKLICYYLENSVVEESLMLKLPYKDICYRRRSCDAGNNMVMYDIDGKRWPCHMFLPMSLGEEKSKNVKELDFSGIGKSDVYCDEECRKCKIEKSCVMCRGMNFSENGTLMGKNADICTLTKIIYRAKGFLAAKKWQKGLYNNLSLKEEKLLLEAILLCSEL